MAAKAAQARAGVLMDEQRAPAVLHSAALARMDGEPVWATLASMAAQAPVPVFELVSGFAV